MNESTFSRQLRREFDALGGDAAWVRKIVGSAYMPSGCPDLLGVWRGTFLGIESKLVKRLPKRATGLVWNHPLTNDQAANLRRIAAAGGLALCVVCVWPSRRALALAPSYTDAHPTLTLAELQHLLVEAGPGPLQRPDATLLERYTEDGDARWDVRALERWLPARGGRLP